jgi:LysR family transcriptional regulator, transcriptional activator of the cysJI operon
MGAKTNLSVLELRQLRHALALNEMGNFHRAAKVEYITQPALTKSIHSLEKKLGRKLFLRHSSGVKPTKHGLTVIHYSQKVIKILQDMLDSLEDSNNDSTDITLGIDSSVSEWIAGDILEAILMSKPTAKIHTLSKDAAGLRESLLNSKIDLALMTIDEKISYPNNLKWQLPTFDGVIYVKHRHTLAGQKSIHCKELLSLPYIGAGLPKQVINWILRETQLKPNDIDHLSKINCATRSLANRYIKNSDGWGCAPLDMIQKEIDNNQLAILYAKNLNYLIQPCIFCSSDSSDNPLVKSIIEKALKLPTS